VTKAERAALELVGWGHILIAALADPDVSPRSLETTLHNVGQCLLVVLKETGVEISPDIP
jgi:hypothetical protein